jgi:hypothetical protein
MFLENAEKALPQSKIPPFYVGTSDSGLRQEILTFTLLEESMRTFSSLLVSWQPRQMDLFPHRVQPPAPRRLLTAEEQRATERHISATLNQMNSHRPPRGGH